MENNTSILKEYENYYSTHNEYFKSDKEALLEKVFTIQMIFKKIQKNNRSLSILDIGCGDGALAYFCDKNGYTQYNGIDSCEDFIKINKNTYSNFSFQFIDAFDFLSSNLKKFDIIFMSHVFEHFDIKIGKGILNLINSNLTNGGIFINIMPNASAIFLSTMTRYNDITHKNLYTETSFGQLVNSAGFTKINHLNKYIGQNSFKRIVHLITIKILKTFVMMSGFSFPRIYTNEIITIAKK